MISNLTIFRACPSNYIILKPDVPKFTIVEVTDYHTKLLNRSRKSLIGRGLFECYPESPENNWDSDSKNKLMRLLTRVIKYKTNQSMLTRYDVFNEETQKIDIRHWMIDLYPIFKEGKIKYIFNASIDVTVMYKLGMEIKTIII